MKTPEEFMAFSHGNVEAFMKSSQAMATGVQDLAKLMTAGAQATMDETMSAFRAMTGVRSFKDAIDMQAALARAAMEKTMSQTGQVAETSFRAAEQALAPLANRVNVAVDSFKMS